MYCVRIWGDSLRMERVLQRSVKRLTIRKHKFNKQHSNSTSVVIYPSRIPYSFPSFIRQSPLHIFSPFHLKGCWQIPPKSPLGNEAHTLGGKIIGGGGCCSISVPLHRQQSYTQRTSSSRTWNGCVTRSVVSSGFTCPGACACGVTCCGWPPRFICPNP
jgi:hypothetical protein